MKSVKLKNGFEYLLVQNNSKLCCIQFKLNVGSKDDPNDKQGLAHVTEHMLYDNNIDNILDDLGVNWNAYTNRDSTGYTFIFKKSKMNKLLHIIKTMMFNMKFQKHFFEKEKNVVIEEIHLKNSQRPHRLMDFVYKNMFLSTYKNSVKGTVKHIENINMNDLIIFYKKWYIPENIKLVCIGDFNSQSISNFLNKLQNIQNETITKPFHFSNNQVPNSFKLVNKTFDSTLVNISCNSIIPGNDIVSNSIFDIISLNIQTNINDILREKLGISYNPHCSYTIYKDFGVLELSATVKKTNMKQALRVINKLIKKYVSLSNLQNLRDNAILINHVIYESVESQSMFYCDEMLKSSKKINTMKAYDKLVMNTSLKDINRKLKTLKFLTVVN